MTANREIGTESTKHEPRQVEAAGVVRRYEPAVLDNVTDLDALLEILGPARGQGQISRNGFGP